MSEGTTGAAKGTGGNPQVAGGRRVLIVEDETLVGLGLKSNLERLGHEVVGQASTAAEAMAFFREKKPDIVLMDIRLDGIDGITVAGQLLKERRVPMIILSGLQRQGTDRPRRRHRRVRLPHQACQRREPGRPDGGGDPPL